MCTKKQERGTKEKEGCRKERNRGVKKDRVQGSRMGGGYGSPKEGTCDQMASKELSEYEGFE